MPELPNERLMRRLEELMDVDEQSALDFRRFIMAFVHNIIEKNINKTGKIEKLHWEANPQLAKAIYKIMVDSPHTHHLTYESYVAERAEETNESSLAKK